MSHVHQKEKQQPSVGSYGSNSPPSLQGDIGDKGKNFFKQTSVNSSPPEDVLISPLELPEKGPPNLHSTMVLRSALASRLDPFAPCLSPLKLSLQHCNAVCHELNGSKWFKYLLEKHSSMGGKILKRPLLRKFLVHLGKCSFHFGKSQSYLGKSPNNYGKSSFHFRKSAIVFRKPYFL